jgi:spore coat polysaccharide biosynthesis predicted glycosyltransferase SpsG
MKQRPRCLVVCQAGEGVGLGHFMRSLVAARSIQQALQAHIHFLVQCDALDPDVLSEFIFDTISKKEDIALAIQSAANALNPDVVVMDMFGPWVPHNFSKVLQTFQGRAKWVAIDALAGCSAFLDLLFVPSFLQPTQEGQLPVNTVFGWDCLLLNVIASQESTQKQARVLVLTGGSDASGLGQTWPTLLNNALPAGALVDWVTGPYAQSPLSLKHPKIHIQNHLAPLGLGSLMQQASFALTVYGVSFYELVYLGIPTVVFSPYGVKDRRELDAVHKKGIALVANDEANAIELLAELMSSPSLAKALSLKSQETLSKSGGERFSTEIAKLLS